MRMKSPFRTLQNFHISTLSLRSRLGCALLAQEHFPDKFQWAEELYVENLLQGELLLGFINCPSTVLL